MATPGLDERPTRAFVLDAFGPPEVMRLVERPTAAPGPGELLVDVEAVGVNFADTMVRRGEYLRDQPLSMAPGMEAVGRVAAAGDTCATPPGTRVAVWTEHGGGYADRIIAPERRCYPVPDDLPARVVVALFLAGTTAHYALHRYGRVRAGDTVLVHAAAGGVGGIAVQLAKLAGARVVGSASTDEKLALVRDDGIHVVVRSDARTLAGAVRDAIGEDGCDVVVDGVGGPLFEPSMRVLAFGGRYVVAGAASQQPSTFDARRLMVRAQSVAGFILARITEQDADEPRRTLRELCDLARDGRVRPRSIELPLEDAADAHRQIEARAHVGKLVLRVD